jgi:hypothetical protein
MLDTNINNLETPKMYRMGIENYTGSSDNTMA